MASVFTEIRKGEIEGYILDDDGKFFAFLNHAPAAFGHTLVVPYQEIDYILDLDEDTYQALWIYARKVAKRLQEITGKDRIGIMVKGFQVPHVHIHLIPVDAEVEMHGKIDMSPQEKQEFIERYQAIET